MNRSDEEIRIRVPEKALEELGVVEQWDWGDGITLTDLIEWLNDVAARFRPESISPTSRAGIGFTLRSFRHYQTLGCIDAPEKAGKNAVYFFRHFLQGLVVRKLLWERIPSERIASLMRGRSNAEYRRMLLEGVELIAAGGGTESRSAAGVGESQTWKRITLSPGIEVHLGENLPRSSKQEREELVERFRVVLVGSSGKRPEG